MENVNHAGEFTSLSLHLNWLYNRARLIYQYSNMAPRLSGQTSIFGGVSLYPVSFGN